MPVQPCGIGYMPMHDFSNRAQSFLEESILMLECYKQHGGCKSTPHPCVCDHEKHGGASSKHTCACNKIRKKIVLSLGYVQEQREEKKDF